MTRPKAIPDLEAALHHAMSVAPEVRRKRVSDLLSRTASMTATRRDLELCSKIIATMKGDIEAR